MALIAMDRERLGPAMIKPPRSRGRGNHAVKKNSASHETNAAVQHYIPCGLSLGDWIGYAQTWRYDRHVGAVAEGR